PVFGLGREGADLPDVDRLCAVWDSGRRAVLVKTKKISGDTGVDTTHTAIATLSHVQLTSMLELGLYVATNIAAEQGGRIKVEKDDNDLVFTLTMPTLAPVV
ncbi:MAG: hypothetical protein AAF653_00650, partial [Chloroflexota bacterium]